MALLKISESLFQRAQQLMPGGVNSPVRAFRSVGGTPPFLVRGEGAYVYDEDGVSYLDLVNSWGAIILGHAHPEVVKALCSQAAKGTSFGAPTRLEVELAEEIHDAMPAIEMVRLVNSGTEATMSAIRLARAATGRNLVVKFQGAYHGHVDSLLVEAGSGALENTAPGTPGIPLGLVRNTIVLPYNDVTAVETAFQRYGPEIAAVIVEPVAANMGVIPPLPGFLETLRQLTEQHGALLIFDEVITGFRLGFGGAQAHYRITPDLTCLGKVIGGGLPVGAYGGRRELMQQVAPAGPVFQAGTLSGNPLAVTAGLTTLRILRQERDTIYPRLRSLADQLATALREAAQAVGVPFTVRRVESLFSGFFHPGPLERLEHVKAQDLRRFRVFFHAMLRQGIHLPPSPFEALFLSLAFGPAEVDRFAEAARRAMRDVQALDG